jgi:rare lipoprotein A (peptidoglycan hydrolase)
MKRIIATLLLIFISSLILNNFFAGINFSKVNTIKVKTEEKDSTIVKVSKEKDTLVSKPSKPIIINNDPKKHHTATWYNTKPHPKVHREHPTAAYNLVPKGTWLLIKNLRTGDSCLVEVTDRHKMGKNHIDLSHMAFGILAKHSIGKIKVIVEQL